MPVLFAGDSTFVKYAYRSTAAMMPTVGPQKSFMPNPKMMQKIAFHFM
jgi:hypothetical protein